MITTRSLTIPKGYYLHTGEQVAIHDSGASISLLPDEPSFFNTLYLELTDKGGIGYVDGATYPRKCYPEEKSVYAINIIKELLKQSLKHPYLIFNKNRILTSFNQVFTRTMGNYRVHPKAFCPTARQMSLIITIFLIELGVKEEIAQQTAYCLAHLFEYDDAYRYRLQDMATECNIWQLRENPRKELLRLMKLWRGRDLEGVTVKMEAFIKPLLYLLWYPPIKRAVRKVSFYVKQMAFDEADLYWASLKNDYKFGGIPHEERIKTMQIPQAYTFVDNEVKKRYSYSILSQLSLKLHQ